MRGTFFLHSAILSFFVGVALRSLVTLDIVVVGFIILVSCAVFLYWLIVRTPIVLLVAVIFVMVAVGIGRFGYSEYRVDVAKDRFEKNKPHEIVIGTVVGEVVEKEITRQFIVATEETRVRVIADRYPAVVYGDSVELQGSVELPESFETDTGRIFNYPRYLAARGVTHQMFRPEISVVRSGGGSFITRSLFNLKEAFLERTRGVVPEPHVSLLGGLVVGAQEAMGEDLINAFRVTGLIHIVVLSGYNITIVAESIMRVLGFLSSRTRAVVGVLAIVLFAILTGATATVVRASIMALLVILARVTGRTYYIIRALLITAFLMVLYNPYVLLFDPSFQLSFLATLGLIFLVPLLESMFGWMGRFPVLRSFVLATLATQLFVLPLLLFQVGMLSTVSIPVNILVLPFVPTIMLFGFLTGVLGFIGSAVALPFGFVSYGLLAYVLKIVEWFSALPFAAISTPQIPAWEVFVIYGVYAVLLLALYRHRKKQDPLVFGATR